MDLANYSLLPLKASFLTFETNFFANDKIIKSLRTRADMMDLANYSLLPLKASFLTFESNFFANDKIIKSLLKYL
jgi:hypothetical protein